MFIFGYVDVGKVVYIVVYVDGICIEIFCVIEMLELVLVYFLVLFDLLLVGLIWCVLLGLIVGVCSGDKGGLVNVGVWVCIDE